MKTKYLSALLLSAVAITPAYAVSGAEYIQSSDITYKIFRDADSSNEDCNIEERTYYKSKEERNVYSSYDGSHCSESKFTKDITETSLSFIKQSMSESIYYYDEQNDITYSADIAVSITNNPGIPVIASEMTVDNNWYEESDMTVKVTVDGHQNISDFKGTYKGKRVDNFILDNIGEVETPFGTLGQCLEIHWDSYTETYYEDETETSSELIYLWICPYYGLVKYELPNYGTTFELEDYSTDQVYTEGMEGGSGGGGGSIPLSVITILGLVTLRRKY